MSTAEAFIWAGVIMAVPLAFAFGGLLRDLMDRPSRAEQELIDEVIEETER